MLNACEPGKHVAKLCKLLKVYYFCAKVRWCTETFANNKIQHFVVIRVQLSSTWHPYINLIQESHSTTSWRVGHQIICKLCDMRWSNVAY